MIRYPIQGLAGGLSAQLEKKSGNDSLNTARTIYDDGLKGNYHNAVGWSITTFNGNQYVAFYNAAGQVVTGQRSISGSKGDFTYVVHTSKTLADLEDNHDFIAIGHDANNFLWIAYGMHNDSMQIFRMNAANSIAVAQANEGTLVNASNEGGATYPNFWNDADGDMFFMFRDGGSGNGDTFMYKYTASSTTWAAAPGMGTDGLFINYATSASAYITYPEVQGNIAYFMFFRRPASGGRDDNTNPAWLEYNMSTGNGLQADGTSQTIPITDANKDLIEAIAIESGLETAYIRHQVDVDSLGTKHIVYTKDDSNGNPQVFYSAHAGSSWSTAEQLTQEAPNSFDPNLDENWLSPQILIDSEDTKYMMFKSKANPGVIFVRELRSGATIWSQPYTIYPGHIGNFRMQNIDFEYWNTYNELHTILQDGGTIYKNNITEFIDNPTNRPIKWFEWAPKQGKSYVPMVSDNIFSEGDIHISTLHGTIVISGGAATTARFRNYGDNNIIVESYPQEAGDLVKQLLLLPKIPTGLTHTGDIRYLDIRKATGTHTGKSYLARFDDTPANHDALNAGTTKTTPGTVNGWLVIDVNNTEYFIPMYTSKTS